jgi:hypothetical protein
VDSWVKRARSAFGMAPCTRIAWSRVRSLNCLMPCWLDPRMTRFASGEPAAGGELVVRRRGGMDSRMRSRGRVLLPRRVSHLAAPKWRALDSCLVGSAPPWQVSSFQAHRLELRQGAECGGVRRASIQQALAQSNRAHALLYQPAQGGQVAHAGRQNGRALSLLQGN